MKIEDLQIKDVTDTGLDKIEGLNELLKEMGYSKDLIRHRYGDELVEGIISHLKICKAYKDAADDCGSDGDLEFDGDAVVSLSDEGGAYVQGWKWVPSSKAKRCEQPGCHAPLPEEEFDGMGDDPETCEECQEAIDQEEAFSK